ncbi:MAG: nucleotidyltransferase family protein [Candidatus Omnitrophica bacterium]|nr:nucleotidyltransferase family protein [Candidatus Omnitrophota bacterium]
MVQEDALKPVIKLLNTLKIPYMLVGGIAVNYYSVPRLTHDADLVIRIQPKYIDDLCKSLEGNYYTDSEMIKEALVSSGQFNFIHLDTGFKIDFWILQKDAYSQLQFSRRIHGKIFGQDAFMISPEDLILLKISWFKESDIQKHFLDAVGIYRMQRETLDVDYLHNHAQEMKLIDSLQKLEKEASL